MSNRISPYETSSSFGGGAAFATDFLRFVADVFVAFLALLLVAPLSAWIVRRRFGVIEPKSELVELGLTPAMLVPGAVLGSSTALVPGAALVLGAVLVPDATAPVGVAEAFVRAWRFVAGDGRCLTSSVQSSAPDSFIALFAAFAVPLLRERSVLALDSIAGLRGECPDFFFFFFGVGPATAGIDTRDEALLMTSVGVRVRITCRLFCFGTERLGDACERLGDACERLGDACERFVGVRERLGDACESFDGVRERLGDACERLGDACERFDGVRDRLGDESCDRTSCSLCDRTVSVLVARLARPGLMLVSLLLLLLFVLFTVSVRRPVSLDARLCS